MSAMTAWWIALGVGAVVVGVVALLLWMILRSARRIRATVEEIWVVGPYIAASTAHLDRLRRINQLAGFLLRDADRIRTAAGRLHEHASGCPGCPYCVTGWGGGGAPEPGSGTPGTTGD